MISETTPIYTCLKCGDVPGVVIPGPHPGGHYAKVQCECGQFLKWLAKPETDRVRRPSAHRNLVERFGVDHCEMCLRKRADLPPDQTLEAQHVVEYAEGGTNDRSNIWVVCTGCHKLIHWVRHWR